MIALMVMMILGVASETRAERASVAVAKATVAATKAIGRATAAAAHAAPKACPWHGLKWLVKHL